MEIKEYRPTNQQLLFEYWKKVGAGVPYFFPVPARVWQACLLEDELDGERLYKSLETYYAAERGRVLGFIQYGQPGFAWDENGQKVADPDIGVIRHLYFDEGRDDVGEALLAQAGDHLARFCQNHAFYHILGMSCNARHGKLHESQSHVDRLLQAHGFQVEHENVYYTLDMSRAAPPKGLDLDFRCTGGSGRKFEIRSGAEVVGTASVRYLDALTGGSIRDTAYLGWIGVEEQHRGRRIGSELMRRLIRFLLDKGYRALHLDTAVGNLAARAFYAKLGFRDNGRTRSYVLPRR